MNKPDVDIAGVSQSIDLEELTGIDLSDYRGVREAIGQAIIDRIVSRTNDGRSLTGGRLKSPYSKAYQKSLQFKAAGKSASDVNMTLTGDMLGTLNVVADDGSSFVKVAVDDDQAPKAYNHIVGDTVPRRNWFGITAKEMKDILDDFSDDLDAARQANAEASDMTPDRSGKLNALDILNGLLDGEDDGLD